jgi:hypothetical protein
MQPEPSSEVRDNSALPEWDPRLDEGPERLQRLERRVDGKLWAITNRQTVSVKVVRCFPWSAPTRFFSLRAENNHEVALIADLNQLDTFSRTVIEDELVTAGFVLDIVRVEQVKEDFEIRCWKVQTRQGPRTFQTSRDSWPRKTPSGELLVQDVAGDLFRIPSANQLDPKSRRLVWALVD